MNSVTRSMGASEQEVVRAEPPASANRLTLRSPTLTSYRSQPESA